MVTRYAEQARLQPLPILLGLDQEMYKESNLHEVDDGVVQQRLFVQQVVGISRRSGEGFAAQIPQIARHLQAELLITAAARPE